MKILEKKSVDVNFTESLLRMAADDVEGNKSVLNNFIFNHTVNYEHAILYFSFIPEEIICFLVKFFQHGRRKFVFLNTTAGETKSP